MAEAFQERERRSMGIYDREEGADREWALPLADLFLPEVCAHYMGAADRVPSVPLCGCAAVK